MLTIHQKIEPIYGFIEKQYLYDMNGDINLIKCHIQGLSLYPGCAPSLDIVIDEGDGEGSLFMYMPINAFKTKKTDEIFNLNDLVYYNCPNGTSSKFELFDNIPVIVYLKNKNKWIDGKYLFSIDWYENNISVNFILLDNGYLAVQPNHKIKFSNKAPKKFEEYKKLRHEWVV